MSQPGYICDVVLFGYTLTKKAATKNKHRKDRLSLPPHFYSSRVFILRFLQRLYLFLLLLPLAMLGPLISFLCIHLLSFLLYLFPPQQFPWKKAVFKLLLFIRATRPASLLCGQRRQQTASLSSHGRRCQESLLSAKLYLRDFSQPQA